MGFCRPDVLIMKINCWLLDHENHYLQPWLICGVWLKLQLRYFNLEQGRQKDSVSWLQLPWLHPQLLADSHILCVRSHLLTVYQVDHWRWDISLQSSHHVTLASVCLPQFALFIPEPKYDCKLQSAKDCILNDSCNKWFRPSGLWRTSKEKIKSRNRGGGKDVKDIGLKVKEGENKTEEETEHGGKPGKRRKRKGGQDRK